MKAAEEAVKAEKEAEVAKEEASKVTFADRFSAAVDALFDRVPALEPIRETVLLALHWPLHRAAPRCACSVPCGSARQAFSSTTCPLVVSDGK